MATPSVTLKFINGQLGQSTVPNDDGVFLILAACTNGLPGQVTSIVQSNEVIPLLGFGAAAELAAQILALSNSGLYVVACNRSAGSTGTVSQSRVGAPALTLTSLFGLPGTPWAASFANAGQGQIFFDATSTIQLSSAVATGSVTITTAGALGTAVATVVIGATTVTDVTLTSGAIAIAGTTVVIDAVLPLNGAFVVGDVFNAIATPTDNANLVVSVTSISANGQAQFTYSLDGGVTVSSPISTGMNAVTSYGATQPALALSGTSPGGAYSAVIEFLSAGTAYGIIPQCNGGVFASADGTLPSVAKIAVSTNAHLGSSGSEGFTAPINYTFTVTTGGAVGTAYGYFLPAFSGGGTSSVPVVTAATIEDTTNATGITFSFTSSSGGFVVGDVYSLTIQPQATYQVTVGNNSPVGPTYLASTGVVSISPIPNAVVTLASTFGANYSFSATNPSITTSYDLTFNANAQYQPAQSNGQKFGINLAFGYGLQQVGDSYGAPIYGPYVATSDVENALTAAQAAQGIAYALVGIDSNPASFATTSSLASAIDSMLETDAASQPAPSFVSALVCGPAVPSSGTGSNSGTTTSAFVAGTGSLDLERVEMGCGADYITSALTGRRDLRNGGYGYIAREAEIAVQQDPGAVADGALTNVVSTTTPANDGITFLRNRGMTSTVYSGIGGSSPTGVFCYKGVTLAGNGSDYGTVMNRRVADKVAKFAFSALTPYINSKAATVPGKGTITTTAADTIAANVQGQILVNCAGAFQSVTVVVSTTTNIFQNGGIVPVTVSVLPWGYLVEIDVELGFTY